jgi:hypothetical protein
VGLQKENDGIRIFTDAAPSEILLLIFDKISRNRRW